MDSIDSFFIISLRVSCRYLSMNDRLIRVEWYGEFQKGWGRPNVIKPVQSSTKQSNRQQKVREFPIKLRIVAAFNSFPRAVRARRGTAEAINNMNPFPKSILNQLTAKHSFRKKKPGKRKIPPLKFAMCALWSRERQTILKAKTNSYYIYLVVKRVRE